MHTKTAIGACNCFYIGCPILVIDLRFSSTDFIKKPKVTIVPFVTHEKFKAFFPTLGTQINCFYIGSHNLVIEPRFSSTDIIQRQK